MSSQPSHPVPCAEIQDDLAELALGTLSGRRRAEVLLHVGSCAGCSTELQEMATVADLLLLLLVPAEPPVGFELRLAERLRSGAKAPLRRRLVGRVGAMGAAAAVAGVLGVGVGGWFVPRHQSGPARSAAGAVATARLQENGRTVGNVTVSAGRPAWMFVTVSDLSWNGAVRCAVTLAGGTVDTVGPFRLSGGYGAWGTALPSAAAQVRSVRLVSSAGVTLATARMSA